jgi:hypothetical protein
VLGMPCFTTDPASVEALQSLVEREPDTAIEARVDTGAISAGALRLTGQMPQALRDAFVSGQWNPTAMLLAEFDQVKRVAGNLPYVSGF